jgi:molybdopterin synthase catalytic subunit
MDYLKTRAPFWKRVERAASGSVSGWVDAKSSDDAAADRWGKKPGHNQAAE